MKLQWVIPVEPANCDVRIIEDSTKKEVLIEVTLLNDIKPTNDLPSLLLKDGSEFKFSEEDIRKLVNHYPGLDVRREIRKMAAWCDANQEKRKTVKGVKRFVTAWLNRAVTDSTPVQGKSSADIIAEYFSRKGFE